MIKIFTFTSLFLAIALSGLNQNGVLMLGTVELGNASEENTVRKKRNKKVDRLENVSITIYENSQVLDEMITDFSGSYQLYLNSNLNYELCFSKDGYIPKVISVDTHHMTEEFVSRGFELYTDVTLYELSDSSYDSYSRLPVAKCYFNTDENTLLWDMEYAQNAYRTFLDMQKNHLAQEENPEDAVIQEKINYDDEIKEIIQMEKDLKYLNRNENKFKSKSKLNIPIPAEASID